MLQMVGTLHKGVPTKEGRGKKEEEVNIEKKGKKIEITISNQLEQLFLSIGEKSNFNHKLKPPSPRLRVSASPCLRIPVSIESLSRSFPITLLVPFQLLLATPLTETDGIISLLDTKGYFLLLVTNANQH